MSPARSLIIASLFFIDVRVRAEEVKDTGCWGKEVPCAVHSLDRRQELKAEGFSLTLAAGSLVEQRDDRTIQLVNGDFYADTKAPIKFNTPYASFWCPNECQALIERRSEDLTVKSLKGDWVVQRKGEKKEYRLPCGMQVSVSPVQTGGVAHMDFPQSLPWLSTVTEWAKLFGGEKDAFKKELSRFRGEWQGAVESASLIHAEAAARTLASHEAGLAKERARRRAIEREERALRELFRKKNYIDP